MDIFKELQRQLLESIDEARRQVDGPQQRQARAQAPQPETKIEEPVQAPKPPVSKPAPVAQKAVKAPTTAAIPLRRQIRDRLRNKKELRQAILLQEILAAPVSMRQAEQG